ncbi:MAG: hypothetical protein U1E65_06545 [Myxococcota bacterium]
MSPVPRLLWCAASLLAATACTSKESEANQRAKQRIWGRDAPVAEVEAKAKEKIDTDRLSDPTERTRALSMSFEEVVAREGIVEYHGIAHIEVTHGQRMSVVEDSLIRQGLFGSFQLIQRDGEGAELRQGIYNNGVFFLSNGGGKMRVEGMVRDRAKEMREELYEPLRVFSGYFGPRFGLVRQKTTELDLKSAVVYEVALLEGPAVVESKNGDAAKSPKSLKGTIIFDQKTGVPLKVELDGLLEVPGAKDKDGKTSEPGRIEVHLESTMKTIEGADLKPEKFIPTITRHATDPEPLGFLDGGTHTSTIIGGRRKAAPPPEPESEE